MEETNIIKMEVPTNEEPKKLSYEELENVARNLHSECQKMYIELQRMRTDNTFKRLDYLFKSLEFYSLLDSEYVKACANEIKEIMTLPEVEVETNAE